MSKGAFNFNTQAVSSFELARSQQYRSEAEYVYYNAQIINNTTDTVSNQKDPAIEYIDTRIRPVVSKVSDYTVSVENFTIDGAGKNLPLFIPQIRKYQGNSTTVLNRNPNDTIYDITFTWRSGGTQVIQSTRTVQWEPENLAPWASQPLPYGEYTGPQPEIAYYYCYTYSHWLKLVNAALACAWEDVKLAANTKYPSVDFGTKCPFYTYDKVTNLFSLWQDSNTCVTPYGSPVSTAPFSPTNAPNPLDVFGPSTAEGYSEGEFSFVGYNTNFEGLFTNFSTKYYGSGTPLSSSGIVLSNPLGNEPCGVLTNPEVDTVGVSGYDGTAMTVTWDATPNPVPSSNWVFELPLNSVTPVSPLNNTPSVFFLTGNPVASYLKPYYFITGSSKTNNIETSSFEGYIGNYDQASGALVITVNNVSPPGSSGNNWTFEVGTLESTATAYPRENEPLTLPVNWYPSDGTLITEGTAVDLIGSSGTVKGNVISYQESIQYAGFTGADPEIDGFAYTTSSGPTGKFNPYVVFKAQDGVFQPGDYVEGSQSQATGKVIQVLAGNTNLPNTININNLNGSFKIGDLVGLTGSDISGLGTIIDISGPNEGLPNVQPMVKLTFSGQKNPFKINDIVYTNFGALGRITDIIGPNTGYARVGYTNQNGQFGMNEPLQNSATFGTGTIISVEAANTGYATVTYINATSASGAGSKFAAGDFLISNGTVFAEVISDDTDAVDANGQGNQGHLTARMLNPANWTGEGWPVDYPPAPGAVITGSGSGTSAKMGGYNFLENGSLTLGNISGPGWIVGDQIVNTSPNQKDVTTAEVTNFNYIDGGQLIIELIDGEFKLNDIIYSRTPTGPELFILDSIDAPYAWKAGDLLTWTGGSCTLVENRGFFNGLSYLVISNVAGPYPTINQLISNPAVNVQELIVTGLSGGFAPGQNIYSTTSSALVNFISDNGTRLILDGISGPVFSPGNTIRGQTGLNFDAQLNYYWVLGNLTIVTATFATYIPGTIIRAFSGVQGEGGTPPPSVIGSFGTGVVIEANASNVFCDPYGSTANFVGANPLTHVGSIIDRLPNGTIPNLNFQRLQNYSINGGTLTAGAVLSQSNGTRGKVDVTFQPDENINRHEIILYDCTPVLFRRDLPIIVTGSAATVASVAAGVIDSVALYRNVTGFTTFVPSATVQSFNATAISRGSFIDDVVPDTNAQIQTVYVDNPPDISDTVLTVQNIVGDFPIGSEIVDLGTGSGAQITQTAFQNGSMIVQPINGTFETSDRMVGPDGSANFYEQYLQTLSGSLGSTATGTSSIKEDDGTYLTLQSVDGSFISGGTFTITSPAGSAYVGVTGLISQIPNFVVGEEIYLGTTGGTQFGKAIVVSDTGYIGGPTGGTIVVNSVERFSNNNLVGEGRVLRQYHGDGPTGSYSSAGITGTFYSNPIITILPSFDGTTGTGWTIKPSTLTSSTLATPSVNGQSVLEMNLNDNEVVFYPGDTLKVTQYEPILPVGTIFYPENVVQIDLSAGNGVIQTLQSIFPSSPDTGATYVVLVQDYESTSTLWSPVASIVVATTFIPVREEYSGQPIVLGTANNGTQGNATTASFQKDLIETPIDDIRPQVGYRGMLKYQKRVPTFTSLSLSNDDLKNLDIGMYWRNRLTNKLIPLTLFNGGSTNVRLMFKKIYE